MPDTQSDEDNPLADKSIPELFEMLLDDSTEDEGLIYSELWHRNRQQVYDFCMIWANSDDPDKRALAITRLPHDVHPEKLFDQLAQWLANEIDPNPLCSIGCKFANLRDERAIDLILPYKNHPHEDVRFGVVIALMHHDDPRARAALIELSSDSDNDVRDWATAGLGWSEVDSPEIRAALFARIDDPDTATRIEAFAGLATRRDRRAVEPLLQEFLSTVAHPLCEALMQLRDFIPEDHPLFALALEECNDEQNWWSDRTRLFANGVVISVEDSTSPDALALLQAMYDYFIPMYGTNEYGTMRPIDTSIPRTVFLVARLDDVPVACGAIRPHDEQSAEVKRIFVMQQARGRGIAKAMMTELERHARAFGYTRLILETGTPQTDAIALYESIGFTRIPCYGDYADERDSVCFEKALP